MKDLLLPVYPPAPAWGSQEEYGLIFTTHLICTCTKQSEQGWKWREIGNNRSKVSCLWMQTAALSFTYSTHFPLLTPCSLLFLHYFSTTHLLQASVWQEPARGWVALASRIGQPGPLTYLVLGLTARSGPFISTIWANSFHWSLENYSPCYQADSGAWYPQTTIARTRQAVYLRAVEKRGGEVGPLYFGLKSCQTGSSSFQTSSSTSLSLSRT